MPLWLLLGWIVLCLFALGTAVYWFTVGFHIFRTMRLIPTARAGLRLPFAPEGGVAPRVCVFVPAHNEELSIADAARTLAAQDYPAMDAVFVLDRCTDRTRGVLESSWCEGIARLPTDLAAGRSLEVIEINGCPEGWAGKPHALHHGVTHAAAARDADLLLFLDADTSLSPGVVRATVALMRDRRVGMLSLLSTLTHDRWFEWLLQPAATMELLRQYPIVRANATTDRRAFANGQYILIERGAYDRIGGHEALRGAILEDVEMARRCEWHDVPAALLLADDQLRCRMYESYAAFRRGWRRIFCESANRKPARLRRLSRRVRLIGSVAPMVGVLALCLGLWQWPATHEPIVAAAAVLGAVGTIAYLGVGAIAHRMGRCPMWAIAAAPVGWWLVGGILQETARDLERGRPTEWGGMSYARPSR